MPTGTYELLDRGATVRGAEEFRCAPGPIGWRYFATVTFDQVMSRVDLSVDARWHPVRVRIENDAHHLILAQRPTGASIILDDETAEIETAAVASFPSPAFLVAATRALPDGGETDAITIDPVTLQPARERLSFDLLEQNEEVPTPVGTFTAARWRTGGREFWVAGDVVVAAPGLRLISYDRGAAGPIARV